MSCAKCPYCAYTPSEPSCDFTHISSFGICVALQIRHVRSLDEKLVERAKAGAHPGKTMMLVDGQVTTPPPCTSRAYRLYVWHLQCQTDHVVSPKDHLSTMKSLPLWKQLNARPRDGALMGEKPSLAISSAYKMFP